MRLNMGWAKFADDEGVRQHIACYGIMLRNIRLHVSSHESKVFVKRVEVSENLTRPAYISQHIWDYVFRSLEDEPMQFFGESSVFGDLANNGVKLYRPTSEQADSYAEIEMRFPSVEYRQPFSTVVVDVPPDSRPHRESAVDQWSGAKLCSVAVRHIDTDQVRGGHIGTVLIFEDGHVNNVFIPIRDGESMEDALSWVYASKRDLHGSTVNDDFVRINTMAVRVALNSCLFLANYGAKSVGRESPDLYEDLLRTIKKKKASEKVRGRARLSAMLMPEVFTIDQRIDLREATAAPASGAGGTGGTVSPHWRRAHWAMQAHGPGRSERKMVFRKASFVNRERFAGTGLDMSTTYTNATGR